MLSAIDDPFVAGTQVPIVTDHPGKHHGPFGKKFQSFRTALVPAPGQAIRCTRTRECGRIGAGGHVEGADMSNDQVDALVIFGATGDLAKLETFPALVGLVERGVLEVPVIGVAKSGGWGIDQFRDYATASLRLNNM